MPRRTYSPRDRPRRPAIYFGEGVLRRADRASTTTTVRKVTVNSERPPALTGGRSVRSTSPLTTGARRASHGT